jgi:acetyl-CoA acetyltransferase
VVDLANGQLFGLGREQINSHGDVMSLGHPIGTLGILFETQIIARFKHLHYWK